MSIESKRKVLAEIADRVPEHKQLARSAASLAKNFKPTTADSLRRTKDLAYWLFVYDKLEESLAICKLLNNIKFSNDYNIWTWVEMTLALEWKLRTIAEQPEAAQHCTDEILSTYTTGSQDERTTNSQVLERRLNGSLLYDSRIAEAEQDKDPSSERNFRLLQIGQLLFIQALGGSKALPVPELERQVDFQLAKLRA